MQKRQHFDTCRLVFDATPEERIRGGAKSEKGAYEGIMRNHRLKQLENSWVIFLFLYICK